jgi:hypothetical protein
MPGQPINLLDALARSWEDRGDSPIRVRVEVYDSPTHQWFATRRGYQVTGVNPTQALAVVEKVEKLILEMKKGKYDQDRQVTDNTVSAMPEVEMVGLSCRATRAGVE